MKLQNFSQKGFLAPLSPSVFMHGIRYSLSALPYAVANNNHSSPHRGKGSVSYTKTYEIGGFCDFKLRPFHIGKGSG